MNPTSPRPLSGKIQTRHRALQALVYVRQSSLQQIHDHPESRARQYALADHAVALGWSADQVVVIDEDQGQSGQRADSRAGFQRLLTDVTLGRVGLILGLEMSRLARSCKDWHQLLEVCALVGTLLADQDGVYDPRDGIRPVSAYHHLEGYAAMKEQVIGWRREELTAEQIASRLNGEGARPPKHGGRYTRDGVRTLLSRWGVSTAEALVGRLGEAEWWLPDLIRELGVDGRKMRSWVRQGWVHARRAPAQRRWVVWADADELVRLRQLLRQSRLGAKHHPSGLTSPKPRPGTEPP